MNLAEVKKLNLPIIAGCYRFYNSSGKIIYIGKAVNLRSRVFSYWQKGNAHTPAKQRMVQEISRLEWTETESEIEALLLEANLIKKHQPFYNIDLRDDKRFYYVHVSLEDEIPGVFLTRTVGQTGIYYGPFVSSRAVKETLKALRKIWPYCSAKRLQKKPCFYYQISRCLGPCTGKVSRQEYLNMVIKPLMLFFEGHKGKVVRQWQKELKEKKKKQDEEGTARLEYLLSQMEKVLEHTKVLSLAEKYANDTVELAKILNLPTVPDRIEGYDISNIFGREAVGSMVVFRDGEADSGQYRKFKIKENVNKDGESKNNLSSKDRAKGDVMMIREILERRLKHDWPLPDLLVVDGGKAQVNVVFKVFKKHKLNIPIIGIVKGEGLRSAGARDKLYFPGQSKPLELSLASPALHLIKRVRDEAHRFAIGYHRRIRSKSFLSGK